MIKTRTVVILLVILSVMVMVGVVRELVKPKDKTAEEYRQKIGNLDSGSVSQVMVEKQGSRLELKKEAAGWQVEGYRADQQAVNQLINQLLKPNIIEVVAETNAQHKNLGVDEAGIKLTLNGGEKQVGWVIGNSNTDGYFVKLADSDAVYLIKELPNTATTKNDWLDKLVSQIIETQMKALTLTNQAGKQMKLVRTGSDWFVDGKTEALDREPLSPLLTTIAALNTPGLVADETQVGKNILLTLVVETDGGSQTLKIYPLGKDKYAIESSDRLGKFELDLATFEALNLDPKTLKPKPAATPTLTP